MTLSAVRILARRAAGTYVARRGFTSCIGAGVLCFALLDVAEAQEHPRLILREVSSIPLPAVVDISSARMLNDSTVALLSRFQRRVAIVSRTSARIVCPNALTTPIALSVRDGALRILDAARHVILDPGNAMEDCRKFPLEIDSTHSVLDAIAVRTGWVVLVRSDDAQAWLLRFRDDGSVVARWRIDQRSGDPFMATQMLLTAAGDSAIASSTVWPFNWAAVGRDGPSTARMNPINRRPQVPRVEAVLAQDWLGLRVVALDAGYLQVIAQRSGERRALVLYDHLGHPVRITEIDVTLGPLESQPRLRRLLMLRRTDAAELVVYTWEWGAQGNP